MNIIEFVEDPNLIGDKSLSPAQKTALKAIYGLRLTAEETRLFTATTGLDVYPGREFDEVTAILGRRSGKSDKLASTIALYEALGRKHDLSVGETGVVMIVSSELKRQSRIVWDYCLGKLERSKILRRSIKRATSDEIELSNGITIQTFPCSNARIRGVTLAAFIGDECAFWKSEGHSVDREVLDAARPGLSLPHAKMIKISSPYAMRGEVWNDFKDFHGKAGSPVLVFQGPTDLFNPSFSKKKLEAARRRDPVAFETEYGAKFRADMAAAYDPAVIDAAVDHTRPLELPHRLGCRYEAFVDVAGGGGRDSYAVAIGHKEGDRLFVDVVRSRRPKFNPEEVTAQYCDLIRSYRVFQVYGDKFSGDWASTAFEKFGVRYRRAEHSKSELYCDAEGPFNTGLVNLPARPTTIAQLKALVRKTHSGGRDSVDTDAGQPEDEANVVAGLLWLLGYKRRALRIL